MIFQQEGPLRFIRLTGRAASMEAALLMASHWPPENLPMKEVELRAGYTIAWMQLLFEPGQLTTHSGTLPACCVLMKSNPIAKQFRHFPAKFNDISGEGLKKRRLPGKRSVFWEVDWAPAFGLTLG
jgi:hypothetical protein